MPTKKGWFFPPEADPPPEGSSMISTRLRSGFRPEKVRPAFSSLAR